MLFIFVLGTVIGSFLNVVIIRLKAKKSIFKNRSHCVFCNKKLRWYELIPLMSFVMQLGKCRGCKKRFSWQYPLVELFTGLVFLILFIYEFSFFWFIISCFLIILFVYDLKHYLVPDVIIYPAIILSFVFHFYFIFPGLIGAAFFLVIVLISKGKWMGMGDVKIGALMGLLLGFKLLIVALFLAFLVGALVSIALMIIKKKKLKSEIPFVPFLAGATFISLLWGNVLINWYLNLFL